MESVAKNPRGAAVRQKATIQPPGPSSVLCTRSDESPHDP